LFLGGSNVTQDTNALRENVFASSENGDRVAVRGGNTGSVGRNVVGGQFLELSEDTANLEALLEIVVLVGVDQLNVFTAVEDDGVVLVVTLSVSENGVAGKLNAELGLTHVVVEKFTVTVDESRVETGLLALSGRGLLIEVSDLQIGVGTEQELGVLTLILVELGVTLHGNTDTELAAGHTLKLTFELLGISAEHLDDFGVLNTIQKLDSTAVVHETRYSSVQSLRAKRGPDTCAQGVLGSGRLETNTVERKVINLALGGILLGLFPVELRSLIGENLGVLDEAIPLVRVQLLEVFQESDTRVRLIFTDDLTKGEQDLFAVVRDEDSEGGHVINGQGLRHGSRERLREEGNTTLSLTTLREELGLERLIFLGNEEGRGTESALAFLLRRNLVVQQLLHVINGQKVLAVHGNDDSVPNLRDQNLGLVLDLHIGSGQNLGVDTLGQTRENVSPWRPNGHTKVERARH
jgi:hypothetical protein